MNSISINLLRRILSEIMIADAIVCAYQELVRTRRYQDLPQNTMARSIRSTMVSGTMVRSMDTVLKLTTPECFPVSLTCRNNLFLRFKNIFSISF